MKTQTELLAEVKAQSTAIAQIGAETDVLLQKVVDLEAALANQDAASPELVAAVEAVSAQLKVVDDKVPDVKP